MEKLIDIENSRIVLVLDGGQITDIFLSPVLEGLRIDIIDHDRNPKHIAEKEKLFHKLNENLTNVGI